MAGTGGAYGFPRISGIGESLETAAIEKDAVAIRARIAELQEFLAPGSGTS
jgi:hypothetical protein